MGESATVRSWRSGHTLRCQGLSLGKGPRVMPEAAPVGGLREGSLVLRGLPTALRSRPRGSASGGSRRVPPAAQLPASTSPTPKHCTGASPPSRGGRWGEIQGGVGVCPLSPSLWPIPEPSNSTYPERTHHTHDPRMSRFPEERALPGSRPLPCSFPQL